MVLLMCMIVVACQSSSDKQRNDQHNEDSKEELVSEQKPYSNPGKEIRLDEVVEGQNLEFPNVVYGEATGGWFFEADFPVDIQSPSGEILAQTYAQAIGPWMTSEYVSFFVELPELVNINNKSVQLVFKKANPSGLPENDDSVSVSVNVVSDEENEVFVYWSNDQFDPNAYNCGQVYPVVRNASGENTGYKEALALLFEGPTQSEKTEGYFTSINEGVELLQSDLEEETLRIRLSPRLEENLGGSCKVSAIRAQIQQTVLHAADVSRVEILVPGKTAGETLQP